MWQSYRAFSYLCYWQSGKWVLTMFLNHVCWIYDTNDHCSLVYVYMSDRFTVYKVVARVMRRQSDKRSFVFSMD